ncbi:MULTISPECIES: NAD-glutamate dehydrogenase [Pseudomonas]|jgi:glutamate dehydrogenase|uniref:NAD-glutamate dehydrogenase n=1 Tax=Pseudomonas TaxID=286 RepID=UPI000C86C425|nr:MULTISPECIES: NAD-glutamate dehydrogenase [Pseudomonas]MBU0522239.1 NAD-glutamate dehydrogenase [Gammaproteobacteria bacterium]MBU0817926.1 NAD-glutamate dehydrogenase [Gammaproteobacteria bacterium]MBU0842984.1 NAD-glutamate dehydrogenase [Gammaproteobacteria bacterium]MBU1838765.1 NAD-glutamate dehydrogenase [Gammaproteobacteria bacterium]MDO8403442.1 NAD-glutamate dehydrogenase [Pseudomonas sp.]
MAFFTAASKADFQHQLQAALAQHISEQALPQVALFAEQFFGIISLDELTQRRLSDLAGCTLSAWRLLERFDHAQPQVRVYNPDYERHGWQSTHTAVEVLHHDLPFLVDSVRTELNRRGYSIHTLQTTVLSVRRGSKGELLEILPKGTQGEGILQESLMYLEIDRCANAAELNVLTKELEQVLGEVRVAVTDFEPMKDKVQEILSGLDNSQYAVDPEEKAEIKSFLEWLVGNHFTFLGYEEFVVRDEVDGGHIVYDQDSFLGLTKLLRTGLTYDDLRIEDYAVNYLREPTLLSFAKAAHPSRVHRPAYPDYVSIREIDADGKVIKECRFMGLYTSSVYGESVRVIPYIRRKVEEIERRSGFQPKAHLGKELAQVVEVLPRDDLFQTPVDELFSTVMSIVQIQERNKIRVFLRKDPYGRFCYCLAYVPRDIYSTEVRQKIQQVLMDRLKASDCEFWTFFSESVLARVQLILRVDPKNRLDIDPVLLEKEVVQACRSWQDDYASLVVESFGEAHGTNVLADFPKGFPAGYRERFAAHSAVVDMQHLLSLTEKNPLVMSFYQPLGQVSGQRELHCKLYHADTPLALSDVLPILENLGLRVLGEFPYRLRHNSGREFWIHDFAFTAAEGLELDIQQLNDTLQDAFVHIVRGDAENDAFNRLVLTAGLPWRDVALLRAYARYMKQIRLGFDLGYIASTLNNHTDIARELTRLFKTRFYLARKLTSDDLEDKQQRLEHAIIAALDEVQVLNEDRILRRYLDLIKATLRTNFYQTDANGKNKSYFSFKFNPHQIPELPKPVPKFEIFVYSPRVEGVHLRFGNVARGGLRWSDREEDFRTEVLGLVKAQQVKNSVIVPVGAKGGFLPRRLPLGGSRDEIAAEGIACYRIFISGLLDITDNLKDGALVPPANVVRHDDDDPYLVVAADKGTATFSDIANGIAIDYGFWLGDAFASGGSAGYDHKKMGITAKGAWVGVQRHFRERGINVQEDSITVVGVGDMAGDVFGNGLLMSDKLQLVAAFNHLHIFIDPNPEPANSFAERQRLFDLPRSAWSDYDTSIMSEGGGIFSRSAKSIAISPQMKERFDIQADKLTPTELLNALLKAPVDLLWNGGIGTYVKASTESHADVGDKANDALRVNGNELRCKVVGEGGNLGMTQLGRVEFGLNGGGSNTDFIDNAGGVDCSDHEVNIKILLNEVVQAGDMTDKQRNQLLASMTDEVGNLVLGNNYKQTQALSLAARRALPRIAEYKRLMNDLEGRGKLDRAIEFLPAEEAINERVAAGHGLTRAELSVLISYSKIDLKEALLNSQVPDDDYLTRDMETAFPPSLVSKFSQAMRRHRLKREIVSTQIANDLVNHMGITFVQRLKESTGMSPANVAGAYVIVRDIFHLPHWFRQIESLDYQVSADVQLELMDELMRLGRRATRWFLRARRNEQNAARDVAHFGPHLKELGLKLDELLSGEIRDTWQARYQAYVEAGVPELLARMVAGTSHLYTLLPIIEASDVTGQNPADVAKAYFAVGSALDITWYLQQISALPVENNWQALAREAFRDDVDWQQRAITISVLQQGDGTQDVETRLALWMEEHEGMIERWRAMLVEIRAASGTDYAMYAVANRELLDLALSGQAVVPAPVTAAAELEPAA